MRTLAIHLKQEPLTNSLQHNRTCETNIRPLSKLCTCHGKFQVGAGLQGSFHLGGVHGLVLGQVLLHSMGDKTQKQEKWCPCTGKKRKRKRKSQANEQVRHYEATNCSFFCDSFLSVVKRHCALRPRLFLRSTVTLIISDHL